MFSFSTYKRCVALGALVVGCAVLVPTASAMIPDPDPVQTMSPGDLGYYTHDVGATASDAGLVVESVAVRPDDRATHGVRGALQPGDIGYYTHDVGATASDAGLVDDGAAVRPDDRATHGVRGTLQPGDIGYYTHDVGATASDAIATEDGLISRPAPANGLAAQNEPVVVSEPAPATGFDWRDAGAGIAIGLLAAMFLVGLVIMNRRRGTLAGA